MHFYLLEFLLDSICSKGISGGPDGLTAGSIGVRCMKRTFRVATNAYTMFSLKPLSQEECLKEDKSGRKGENKSSCLWQSGGALVLLADPNYWELAVVSTLSLDLLRNCLYCRCIWGSWKKSSEEEKSREEKRKFSVAEHKTEQKNWNKCSKFYEVKKRNSKDLRN